MAQDLQRLVVSLEAKITQFDNAMKRADGIANKRARAIETRFAAMNKNVTGSIGAAGKGFVALAGVSLGVRGFQELADSATRAENALKIAGLEGEQLKSVYDQLFSSAQRNAAPFETLTTLYGRAALAQKELNVSTQDLLKFTDNVALALRVAGRSAEESKGALLQLGQAIGSGVVRAEEFNSILEGALPIAQAAAAGLVEAGGSVAKLRTLVIEGKVSSEAFFRAFEAGAGILQSKAASATLTNAQAFEQLRNALIKATGQFDDAVGVTTALSTVLSGLGDGVDALGNAFERNAPTIDKFYGKLQGVYQWFKENGKFISDATGGDAVGNYFGGVGTDLEAKALLSGVGIRKGTQQFGPFGKVYGPFEPYGPFQPKKPVSLADFAQPKAQGSSDSRASASNDFDNEMQRMRERTALLNAETAARSRLNPLAADYQQQIDAAVYRERLLNEARAQGLKITPEIEKSIDAMANSYAAASAAADHLANSQEEVQRRAQDMRELGRDVMGGFISDMRQGTSAAESLANALNRIADKMIDMALQDLFAPASGGGGLFSGLSSLFGMSKGGVFVTGQGPANLPRFARGGISRKAAIFGEAGPEAAVPLPDGRSIPVQLKAPPVGARASGNVNLTLNIDARGATSEGVNKLKTDLVPTIQKVVKAEVNQMFTRDSRFARAGI